MLQWLIQSSTLILQSSVLPSLPPLSDCFEIISTLLEQIWALQKSSMDRTWSNVVMDDLCTHKWNNMLQFDTEQSPVHTVGVCTKLLIIFDNWSTLIALFIVSNYHESLNVNECKSVTFPDIQKNSSLIRTWLLPFSFLIGS